MRQRTPVCILHSIRNNGIFMIAYIGSESNDIRINCGSEISNYA